MGLLTSLLNAAPPPTLHPKMPGLLKARLSPGSHVQVKPQSLLPHSVGQGAPSQGKVGWRGQGRK